VILVTGATGDVGAQPVDDGASPALADAAPASWVRITEEPEPATHTVEAVTGVEARTFWQRTRDHAGAFP
jgi:hypothetical protein